MYGGGNGGGGIVGNMNNHLGMAVGNGAGVHGGLPGPHFVPGSGGASMAAAAVIQKQLATAKLQALHNQQQFASVHQQQQLQVFAQHGQSLGVAAGSSSLGNHHHHHHLASQAHRQPPTQQHARKGMDLLEEFDKGMVLIEGWKVGEW